MRFTLTVFHKLIKYHRTLKMLIPKGSLDNVLDGPGGAADSEYLFRVCDALTIQLISTSIARPSRPVHDKPD